MPDGKISRIPALESVVTTCYQDGRERYIITRKLVGGDALYTLYEICGREYQRLGRGPSPIELEKKFQVW